MSLYFIVDAVLTVSGQPVARGNGKVIRKSEMFGWLARWASKENMSQYAVRSTRALYISTSQLLVHCGHVNMKWTGLFQNQGRMTTLI